MEAGPERPLDDGEFDEIYRRHFPAVLKTIRIMVMNELIAEDLAQDTFVRAYRFRGRYDRSRPPGPWLHTIAVNLVRSHMRRARLISILSLSSFRSDPVAATPDWGSDTALLSALATLPPEERAALVLHHVHGHEYSEVAAILRIPIGTVGSRLNRARTRMREAIQRQEEGEGPARGPHPAATPPASEGDRA